MTICIYSFADIQHFLKISEYKIDNVVCSFHYRATRILLLACCILASPYHLFGSPIQCMVEGVDLDVLQNYCWITGTFTLPDIDGMSVKDSNIEINNLHGKGERSYKKYYQWVFYVLLLQSIMFYMPRYLWKYFEDGLIKTMVESMQFIIYDEECSKKMKCKQQRIVNFFVTNRHKNKSYFWKFVFCEFLNLFNTIGQIMLIDLFLNGEFFSYGTRFLKHKQQHVENPMDLIFPKRTKCLFHKYGPSGELQKIDALCVLPINVVNEKIYLLLWFWLFALLIITSIALGYRLAVILSASFRKKILNKNFRLVKKETIDALCAEFDIGDWFLFYRLGNNLDLLIFRDFSEQLMLDYVERQIPSAPPADIVNENDNANELNYDERNNEGYQSEIPLRELRTLPYADLNNVIAEISVDNDERRPEGWIPDLVDSEETVPFEKKVNQNEFPLHDLKTFPNADLSNAIDKTSMDDDEKRPIGWIPDIADHEETVPFEKESSQNDIKVDKNTNEIIVNQIDKNHQPLEHLNNDSEHIELSNASQSNLVAEQSRAIDDQIPPDESDPLVNHKNNE